MADLSKQDDDSREAWIMWAIELVRRGLRPLDVITVHGPHGHDADFMWGEAECSASGINGSVEVEFCSARCNSIWDLRGLRVWTKDERSETWPLLKDLPPRLRRWLKAARKERKRLAEAAATEREQIGLFRRWFEQFDPGTRLAQGFEGLGKREKSQ